MNVTQDPKKPIAAEAEMLKEQQDLENGAVMKAITEAGEGDDSPDKGDLVFVSYFYSTPLQDGEAPSPKQHASYPQPYVLGKGERGLLRGIELGLMGMHKGEISVLNIKPEYAFKHPKCTETPPSHINPSKPLQVFLKLIDFQHTSKSAPIIPCGFDELGVVKRTEVLGDGWETPRIPFEVHLSISRCRWMADLSLSGAPGETIFEGLEEIFCELGDGTLPPGIEDAVSEMKRGEKATVWCPESGARGGKKVPEPFYDALEEEVDEESTDGEFSGERFVEYEITLHDFTQVRDLVGDGSVMKRILKKGRGEFPTDCPLEDTSVTFHLKVRQAGSTSWLTDTRGPDGSGQPLTVETGTGDLPEAIDSAVRLMIPEEVAFVTSDWRHSYQGREDIPDGMELESRVEFEIELVDFVPEKNWGEMTVDDMLGKCVSWKEQGNALFKKAKYQLAKTKYTKGLKFTGKPVDFDSDEHATQSSSLKCALYLNIAACSQKMQEYGDAISWCDKAINDDPDLAKAFFRRGIARYHLNNFEEALLDFEKAKELDPKSGEDVDREIWKMKAREKAGNAKQRAEMKGFLG